MLICEGCAEEVDPDTCWCGSEKDGEHDNHIFIPMGCECFREHPDAENF